ncbi:hypothetical protein KAFR_0A01080 [Kazachstania africana CBS 2517]|uniref:Uncharacterized protein n=1 Tax=Kazachstania africana (strain ATCC 22294 / BCRC 22015 / CBS 2517 / CECT 1963 / NBRC 1671 / NRRL Y-8276) TaxID=1071382 RepID=H2AME7_KAZAF|nr:hypothetical protein KAFR_0A01080 [Kazachstania africana CBS 2517]CCF55547.1 hypothetical protein KAFR_0A01080 [Kazachstania africana CBS 2517]
MITITYNQILICSFYILLKCSWFFVIRVPIILLRLTSRHIRRTLLDFSEASIKLSEDSERISIFKVLYILINNNIHLLSILTFIFLKYLFLPKSKQHEELTKIRKYTKAFNTAHNSISATNIGDKSHAVRTTQRVIPAARLKRESQRKYRQFHSRNVSKTCPYVGLVYRRDGVHSYSTIAISFIHWKKDQR